HGGSSLDSTRVADAGNVWDDVPDWGGVGARRLARSPAGSLGATLWELQPGGAPFTVPLPPRGGPPPGGLRGPPTVRPPDRGRSLAGGDVVSLPRGAEGGHQLRNDGEEVARVLIVSSNADPDVAEYPETGKIGIVAGGRAWEFHRRSDA